eukprot:CAMPEP_0184650028 /NCGR_PEP_ID=MMETSP0308-20130426/7513_1 /TAXON_ID=38269 /ORGANISM="Gloeochaete witrockiana, Strain SAG 46.84" /LENGTH=85 /DNA_ID=CAMNT_0027083249 /DNA_START=594 /DNA_END=851 /DNA_ORIENTATION=-
MSSALSEGSFSSESKVVSQSLKYSGSSIQSTSGSQATVTLSLVSSSIDEHLTEVDEGSLRSTTSVRHFLIGLKASTLLRASSSSA